MPTGITSLTTIGNGLAANDGTGDALRTGADKINANSAAIIAAVNNLAASQAAGRISYLTKADMDADLAHADGTMAEVTNDATTDNNRSYRKSGASGAGSWGATVDRVDTAVNVVTIALDAAVTSATASAADAATSATGADAAKVDAMTAQAAADASAAAALAAQSATETARDTSSGIYATTAKALSNGVKSLTSLVVGSGGTNGTFALAFSGGAGSGAVGTFTVAGGAVVSTTITNGGDSYTSAPSVSFAASSGLTGASATAVISTNVPAGKYFSVPSASSAGYLDLYQNNAGVASLVQAYPSALAVQQPSWSGRVNGWADPFFRSATFGVDFLGRQRWINALGGSMSMAQNPVFDGNALKKNYIATSDNSGPLVYLDELGIVAGDTITVRALVVGDGGNGTLAGIHQTAAGASVGTQPTDTVAVTSATPQLLTLEMVVPATAARFRIYPYTTTSGKTLTIVALWSVKGAAANAPTWPNIAEVTAKQRIGLDVRTTAVEQSTQASIEPYTAVTAASTSTVVDGSGYSSVSRDLPFAGWGYRYTAAGVSFNAVNMTLLARTAALASSRWHTLSIVVRTGATPGGTGDTVIAVGSITVPDSQNSLTNVTILLKDPTTGAVITLTDGSFTGGKYFIGVTATNSSGAVAACGSPNGTLPNGDGQQFYFTTGDPKSVAWNAVSGGSNVPLAFRHQLLTTPVETIAYAASANFAASIPPPPAPLPIVIAPPAVYGVVGRECNVYFDNLFAGSAADYLIDVNASSDTIGQQQNERFTWTPAATSIAGAVNLYVQDKAGNVLLSRSMAQRVSQLAAGTGLTKKVMVIGDSLVNAGVITQTLLDIASTDVMGVTLYGTQGTAPNNHEGRGGWTVAFYATAGPTFYDFTVSGVTTPPQINSTTYDNNGHTYTVQTVTLTGGAGTIRCSNYAGGAPSASGTLTKSNGGVGDATIAFSASAPVSGNPFWVGGALNFGQYLTNNGYPAMDWVFVALGINDIFGYTDDVSASTAADGIFAQLDTLIASIKASGAGTKVGLMIPSPPAAEQNAFGTSYGTGQTRWRDKRNIVIFARQLIAKYAGQEASRIYIVPSNTALDTVNNMQFGAAAAVNSRNTAVTIARQANGVHPATSGYQQIADAVWAFLKYYA